MCMGTVTRTRSSSSSSSSRVILILIDQIILIVERCAPGRLLTTLSSIIPYNSCGSAQLCRRTSCMGDWGTMGPPPTWGSSRDPVRSLPRSRRVHLRELGLPTGRRPPVIHGPASARRAGRDPAHLEAGRSFGGCSQRRGRTWRIPVRFLRSGTSSISSPPQRPSTSWTSVALTEVHDELCLS